MIVHVYISPPRECNERGEILRVFYHGYDTLCVHFDFFLYGLSVWLALLQHHAELDGGFWSFSLELVVYRLVLVEADEVMDGFLHSLKSVQRVP